MRGVLTLSLMRGAGMGALLSDALSTRFDMSYILHGGISGRHGDRTVQWSTPLPSLNQPFRLLRLHPPHLEVHPDGIVDGEFARFVIRVAIGLDAHVHPLQGGFVLVGNPFDHVHRTC